jgi:HAD superfamily hydrolase (TIGR01549 family)
MFNNDIEAVLFDWADVLVTDGFKNISEYEFEEGFGVPDYALEEAKTLYWGPLSLGKITEQKFWEEVLHQAGIMPGDNFIDMIRTRVLDSHVPFKQTWSLVEMIKRYSPNIKCGILSNNCREWIEYWEQKYSLSKTFNPIICSYDVGYRKPQRKMYEAAIKILGVRPERILFFDDQEINVEAATRSHMQAVLFKPESRYFNLHEKYDEKRG